MQTVSIPNTDLVRDINSKALLNKNRKSVEDYKLKRKMFTQAQNSDDRINNLEIEVRELHNKLDTLINLLVPKD